VINYLITVPVACAIQLGDSYQHDPRQGINTRVQIAVVQTSYND